MADEVRLVVSGMVQGVGFRRYVQRQARRLGLSGWVRNCGDGTVELAAQGSQAALDALYDAVVVGPPGAQVYEVKRLESDGAATDLPFAIRRD